MVNFKKISDFVRIPNFPDLMNANFTNFSQTMKKVAFPDFSLTVATLILLKGHTSIFKLIE